MRKRVRKLLVTGGLLALSVTLFGAHRYEKDEVTATPTLADLSHVDLSPAGSNEGRMLLYSHALARLNERLAHYPDDYEASLLKGIIDFKSGRLREARRQLASLIRRVPKFHLAYLVQGDLLLAQTQTVTDFGGTPLLAGLEKPDDKALEQLRAEAEARLNAYLDTLPQNRIPRALLALGRTVKTALVVDKQSHRLYVYRREGDGQPPHLVGDFYVSTGKLSGDKSSSGDMRTPEGVYFLTRHIPNSALPEKYGSGAYPLDYPNELDAHEGKTGEGIWLHGTDNAFYSRPPQDSEGCVVLPNIDLDHVGAGQPHAVEGIHDRNGIGQFLGGGGLEAGEPVHRDDFHGVAPGCGTVGEPGLERLLGAAFDHVQQPGWAGAVADAGQVDDHGDVLVAVASVPPHVFVDPDDLHAVEPAGIVDQDALAFGKDRVVGGVPRDRQPLGTQRRRRVLGRERIGHEVDADADDQPVDPSITAHLRFEQDAGELAAGQQDIVRPFEAERRVWHEIEASFAHGKRRRKAELRRGFRLRRRPQHDRRIEISRRRSPHLALPAAALRLLQRPDERSLGGACACQRLGLVVGAAETLITAQRIERGKRDRCPIPKRRRTSVRDRRRPA